ncbi:hypothetical protein KY320_01165 [Candidatus Woesearchaeota archaeon]|nr:hypothetical protein [Candidatus Woesearchaeota archaeon]
MSESIAVFGGGRYLDSNRLDFLKYQGVLDLEGLYKAMAAWFKERKYDFYEKLYKDKPPELELSWIGERKVNDFYKYTIELYFHFYDIEKVEVIQNGKKKDMVKTRVWISFKPVVIVDWQNRWDKTPLTKTLFKLYFNHVIKREVELLHADKLWYITYKLHNLVKNYLGMETKGNAY